MALELSYLSSHFFSFLCVFGQPASLAHPSTGWARMECFCFYGGLPSGGSFLWRRLFLRSVSSFCGVCSQARIECFFCGVCSFRGQARVECFFFCGVCSFGWQARIESFFRVPSGGRHASVFLLLRRLRFFCGGVCFLQGAGTRRVFLLLRLLLLRENPGVEVFCSAKIQASWGCF